jgi:serine/threonine protein kinase
MLENEDKGNLEKLLASDGKCKEMLEIFKREQELNKNKMLISQKKDYFKQFRIYGMLGKGSFGSVYAAKNSQTGKLYAVKVTQKSTPRSEDLIKP